MSLKTFMKKKIEWFSAFSIIVVSKIRNLLLLICLIKNELLILQADDDAERIETFQF